MLVQEITGFHTEIYQYFEYSRVLSTKLGRMETPVASRNVRSVTLGQRRVSVTKEGKFTEGTLLSSTTLYIVACVCIGT